MEILKNNQDGSLQLPFIIRRQLGNDSMYVLSNSPEHLLLGRHEGGGPVLLSGVLGVLEVPDLLSFFNMFRKTGILHFGFDGGSKSLYFHLGEIVFATSTFASEDLGEVLISLGKAEREQVLCVRKGLTGKSILGKALVEQGVIAPRDLWLATRNQVERIVYQLFAVSEGSFYFETQQLEQDQQLRLSMSTQNLIMEGLRRQDETALYMRSIGSLEHYPIPTGKSVAGLPDDAEQLLQMLVMEQLRVRELLLRLDLAEYDVFRCLYDLLQKGLLKMSDSPMQDVSAGFARILAVYNELFVVIRQRMVGVDRGFVDTVSTILLRMPQPFSYVLRDVEMREKGDLDGHRIQSNLNGLEEGDKARLLVDALDNLTAEMFSLANGRLAKPQRDELAAMAAMVKSRVREIIGRDD